MRRSGQARDGYIVTRSQARLTTEKLAELKDVPGFAETFLPDGKPPEAGSTLKQEALAGTLDHLVARRPRRFLSRRRRHARSRPTWKRSAAR